MSDNTHKVQTFMPPAGFECTNENREDRKRLRSTSISKFSPGVGMKELKEIAQDLIQDRPIAYPKRKTNSGIKVRLVNLSKTNPT
jgi:hypothetical protein